ncbi:MAG: DUF3313 family protein [Phenylobacterium sp.]
MFVAAVSLAAVGFAPPALAAKAPTTWDGLVRLKSKRLDYVYLLPGADFRGYTKVMLDPTELAFKKNWLRDYNNQTSSLSSRLSEKDLQKTIAEATPVASEILAQAFKDGGYPVVTEPGPDVLRVRTGVVDISISAPDVMTAGRSRSYAGEAGYATLVIEARDSVSGALLGRAVDGKVAGDNSTLIRNRVTNRGDFRQLMKSWASISVKGMAELKARSPINDQGA